MNINRSIRQLRGYVGFEPSIGDFILPAVGIFAFGILAGAGVALLFAPMPGKRLREEMNDMLGSYKSRLMLDQGPDRQVTERNAKQAEPFPRI